MFGQQRYNAPLAMSSEAELMRLSAQTNMSVQQLQSAAQAQGAMSVSYTHLTLPTIYSV